MDRRKRTARTVALMSLFTMTETQTDVPVASFVGDGSDLISLIVGIEPVQAGSGDPSPDNVRPISGWTGANIHVSPTTDAEDGTTYSITFPAEAGTVYGGTLDVTTGKLTVDRASVDMGSLAWYANGAISGGTQYAVSITDKKPGETNFICSAYKTSTPNAGLGLICGRATTSIVACNATQTELADFKAAVAGQTIVYELATPIVYDLTPTQVTTLIGTNNIWADTGDIKYIEYNI